MRSWKLTSRKLLGLMEVKSSTWNTTSPGWLSRSGNRLVSSRPTILVIIMSVVISLAGHVPMYWPSRMMVTSSEMRRISSILWDMYTMATPSRFRSSTMRNRASTSFWVREEVGSSRMSTLQLALTALAISTDCIWLTLSSPSICRGSKSMRTFFKSAAVSSYIFLWSTMGMKPRALFMG